jgi:hypothetical protein
MFEDARVGGNRAHGSISARVRGATDPVEQTTVIHKLTYPLIEPAVAGAPLPSWLSAGDRPGLSGRPGWACALPRDGGWGSQRVVPGSPGT